MTYQLPEPYQAHDFGSHSLVYTATQMQSAFDAGRLAGLEEAAKECDLLATSVSNENFIAIANRQLCGKTIRNLKETPCAS